MMVLTEGPNNLRLLGSFVSASTTGPSYMAINEDIGFESMAQSGQILARPWTVGPT